MEGGEKPFLKKSVFPLPPNLPRLFQKTSGTDPKILLDRKITLDPALF